MKRTIFRLAFTDREGLKVSQKDMDRELHSMDTASCIQGKKLPVPESQEKIVANQDNEVTPESLETFFE